MKKITLLFAFLTLAFSYAQQTISFETGEGYALGDINTQNGWVTTGDGAGGFIQNQVVSNELSTDGSFSLKIVQEIAFPGQSSAIVGAFYDYAVPVTQDGSTFSADINISQQDANSSNYIFGLVNLTAGSFLAWLEFDFGGNIFVLVDDGMGNVVRNDTGTAWSASTWYNIRMEIIGTTITFFVDDTEISNGTVILTDPVEQVRFSHDNFEGFAYVDNFRTNDEELSVGSFESETFNNFYNKTTKSLELESSSTLQHIELYSILGQKVFDRTLANSNETINLQQFTNGVYLAKIATATGTKTIKFIKN